MGSDRRRIGRALARLFAPGRGRRGERPQVTPGCEFGSVVEERLKDLGEELGEIKALQRAMLLAVFGGIVALVVDILVK